MIQIIITLALYLASNSNENLRDGDPLYFQRLDGLLKIKVVSPLMVLSYKVIIIYHFQYFSIKNRFAVFFVY